MTRLKVSLGVAALSFGIGMQLPVAHAAPLATTLIAQAGTTAAPPSAAPPAAAPTVPTTQAPRAASSSARDSRVESRIKSLHDRLHITAQQESLWNDVAQTMRDNSARMRDLIQDRDSKAASMNAVDDFQSYKKIADAHADELSKFISVFQKLYDNMSPEQKRNADVVFREHGGSHGRARARS